MSDDNEPNKSWINRISGALQRNPRNRDELVHMISEAKDRGIIDPDALPMIEGVIRVSEMNVSDITIPRPQMVMLESDMSLQDALPIITHSSHSRFPVFDASEDKIIGILLAKDVLQLSHSNPAKTGIQALVRPASFIPDSKRLNVLLKEFRLKHNHMAIVIDEYGNIDGLVTIEDVLEQIVGNIEDEYDVEDGHTTFIKQIDTNITEVDALTPIDEFNAYFDLHFSDEECDTIGGLVLKAFSHLPKEGETVDIEELEITILEASERGIKRLRIYYNPAEET
ncbi:MAG: magnesium/cobalt efflux protein [Coxiella sp. (in: Bacteria)]|nr:MAG: magnesium/cobalt efflux protein [Coxiella sp. (in: g-proteobacteria)]